MNFVYVYITAAQKCRRYIIFEEYRDRPYNKHVTTVEFCKLIYI